MSSRDEMLQESGGLTLFPLDWPLLLSPRQILDSGGTVD